MASPEFASRVIIVSLLISVGAYVWFSRREGTYLNILTPLFVVEIPANCLLQLVYVNVFGADYSAYAYTYVYSTLAIKTLLFIFGYNYASRNVRVSGPRAWSNDHFTLFSFICLTVSVAIYSRVLLGFKDLISDPREIYKLTRTGFGHETFVSSTLGYLAIIFILFSNRSWFTKTVVVAIASGAVLLHGSKAGVLDIVFILLLFQVYVRRRQITLLPALLGGLAIVGIIVALFAATLVLGDGLGDALQAMSEYSDYTRNAMLVIDSRLPVQYGRLTLEANTYSLIPRAIVPSKPKNFGPFFLDEEFFPDRFDEDTGSPAFGIGLQYADFGSLAVIYIALFAIFEGYLASIFVKRIRASNHPSDFLVLVFLGGVSLIPLGVGWLLPEVLLLAMVIRLLSSNSGLLVMAPTQGGQATIRPFQP